MDFVDQFRRLVLLIAKWALIAFLGIGILTATAVGIIAGWQWWSHDRFLKDLEVILQLDPKLCQNSSFPVFVGLANRSLRIVEEVTIYPRARRPGRSKNLAPLTSYQSDQIIMPGKGYGQCWAPSLIDEVKDEDLRNLEWSVSSFTVRFANE